MIDYVWYAVDENDREYLFDKEPYRIIVDKNDRGRWSSLGNKKYLKKGTIKEITGKSITWDDNYILYNQRNR